MARGRRVLAAFLVLLAGGPHAWSSASDAQPTPQDCWTGALTYEICCLPPPDGNAFCWDNYFTAKTCCFLPDGTSAAPAPGPPSPPPPPPPVFPPPPEDYVKDPDQPLQGCEWEFFQEFKSRVSAWYSDAKAPLALFHQFGLIVNQFDDVFRSCAPAALTAMLVKLESAYFEADWKWSELLEIYMKSHHKAVATGRLLKSHHENGWPLEAGMERLTQLRSLGRRYPPEPAALNLGAATQAAAEAAQSAAQGAPPPGSRPPVDIVICYCAERLVWLRALHRMPWRREDRSRATRENIALRIYHKCPSADAGERDAEVKRLVGDWGSYFHTVTVRYVDDAARADDCSAYLAYIVDNYDDLPDSTFFLHADAPEHIPSIDLLTDTIFAAGRGYLPPELGFVHLAHNYVLHELACKEGKPRSCEASKMDGGNAWGEFPTLWKNVFGSSIAPSLAAGQLNAYCCVQFLARSHVIRLRPRSFYQNAWDYMGTTTKSYQGLFPAGRVVMKRDILGRTPCQLAMYIWHAMFGEPLRLPRRQRDRKVPLFMKLHNIEVEALDDEENMNDPYIEVMIGSSMQVEAGPWSTYDKVGSLFTDVPGDVH